jgi:PTH1 family peptidyl-tRNA hydrolase
MNLLIGLGNPGTEYTHTRHNAGFISVNHFLQHLNASCQFKKEPKFESLFCKTTFKNKPLLIAQPQTFMNLSGRAAKKIIDYYKISPENLLLVHDDLDLPFGTIRLSFDSGSAGHNGVQSIIQSLGTKAFTRLRIGINPEKSEPFTTAAGSSFVLANFSQQEQQNLPAILDTANQAIISFFNEGFAKTASLFNIQRK